MGSQAAANQVERCDRPSLLSLRVLSASGINGNFVRGTSEDATVAREVGWDHVSKQLGVVKSSCGLLSWGSECGHLLQKCSVVRPNPHLGCMWCDMMCVCVRAHAQVYVCVCV